MKLPTRAQLEKRRAIVLQDMAAKMEAEDFHGVADCAMDAREIDSALLIVAENERLQERIHQLETLVVGVRNESMQWPESVRQQRTDAARPVLAIDRLAEPIRAVDAD